VVSRAAKLLGCRSRDRSRTSCRPQEVGWLVLGSRPAVENGTRSGSKEVWEQGLEVGMSSVHADGTQVRPKRRYARMMEVLIGVDPHKASLAVAAIDEATGELLERAAFPHDRAGLRSLERWAKRFLERRPKRWRTPAVSVVIWLPINGDSTREAQRRSRRPPRE
jgi:hypothetical protein